ncbi:carboxylic ester hydrolase [Comamonas testosteroni]|uniref:Carboxylic ester hydrolase n=2 Tax=Comamonas testosteroni TaxID=285 RepID=A0A5A7MKE8_COMTE|nr:carboxylic ester hydrolase [Comamonas testosteroni]
MRGAMGEDCLNLNVWTPAQSWSSRLPVVVWIHGGGFAYGGGSHPSYDGEALAKRGVVVVTLNYRLGLLGFMAHPQLSEESSERASGNYGLMDQAAALKWVQHNIAAFGGDPQRVTVMGQSAGAHAISALMTSKQADGLFQQAIMQSVGVMRPQLSLQQAEQFGVQIGADIAQLRTLPANEFLALQKKIPSDSNPTTARPISIINDGAFIDRPDYAAFNSGSFAQIPVLVGNVEDEGGGATKNWPIKTVDDFRAFVAKSFAQAKAPAWDAFSVHSDAEVRQALSGLYSDTQYLFGTRELLNVYDSKGLKSFRYVFARHRNDSSTAPIHGDELQFVFDNLEALHRGKQRPFNSADSKVADAMADAWIRFVKTGDPNGSDLPTWPAYSMSGKAFMQFGSNPSVRRGYDGRGIDFTRDYFASTRR